MTELKIKTDRFTVDVQPEFLHDVIEKAVQTFVCTGKLADFIIKEYKMNKYSKRTLADNIRKWQRKRRNIYLNYYLAIRKKQDVLGVICKNQN